MSKRWGRGSQKDWPERCITCNTGITRPKKSNRYHRNTPKVCQRCRQWGIPREKEWGCSQCMKGDSVTGIFNHKPEYCPGARKQEKEWEKKTKDPPRTA